MRLLFALMMSLVFFDAPKVEAASQQLSVAENSKGSLSDETSGLILSLNGMDFVHRWSSGNQHEFTPPGQEDLSSWDDMITIEYMPNVKDAKGLTQLADSVLELYKQRGGKIIGSIAIHTLDGQPHDHFIAALLGTSEVVEFIQVRLQLLDGVGTATIYARRFYAPDRAQMSGWLPKNAPQREQALLQWKGAPSYRDMTTISSANQ